MEKSEFLNQAVLSSGLIPDLKDRGYVETFVELKMSSKVAKEVTFGDFLTYASGKIKRGLKFTSFHKKVMNLMISIFNENDPADTEVFQKCLPSGREPAY